MNNLDRYFKGQQKNEEFICFFRHHWITLLRNFIYLGIFTVIVLAMIKNIDVIKNYVTKNPDIKGFLVFGFLIGTIFIHGFFMKIFKFFINVGIITDMRILDHKKSLFFKDNMEAIDMANIQDIEKKEEGLLPNLLGYGDIIIYLSASASVKTFLGVPNADFHFRCIGRQKEMRQRNLRAAAGIKINVENHDLLEQKKQAFKETL